MKISIFFTLISLSAHAWHFSFFTPKKQIGDNRDYTSCWNRGDFRNQYNVGSCHIFATNALVEYQLYKHKNKKRKLSESFLLYKHLKFEKDVLELDKLQKLNNSEDVKDKILEKCEARISAGGSVKSDLRMMQRFGTYYRHEVPYKRDAIDRAFLDYKDIVESSKEDLINHAFRTNNIEEMKKKADEVENQIKVDGTNSFRELVKRPLGPPTRRKIKNFAKELEYERIFKKNEISELGKVESKKRLLSYLSCNPISITIKNAKHIFRRKDIESGSHRKHAVAVVGYRSGEDVFVIRNSWGDKHYYYIKSDMIVEQLVSAGVIFHESDSKIRNCN